MLDLNLTLGLSSIIGIHSFKGSFRRTCHLQSQEQGDFDLSQGCGAWIDPATLDVVGYLSLSNTTGTVKGYVCPLGQICKVNLIMLIVLIFDLLGTVGKSRKS